MQMQRQAVRPLKLTAKCAVVMPVDDCLQTVCLCVIIHVYMSERLRLHMFRLPVRVYLEGL